MALWKCTDCTTAYAVGAPRCPQCGSDRQVEEGAADMAKITVHGGPSNAAADSEKGGEESSPGTNSATSSEKEQTSPAKSENGRRSRARGAGSRSNPGRAATSSTAGPTATSGPETAAADGEAGE